MQRKAKRENRHPLHYLTCEAPSADQISEYRLLIEGDRGGSTGRGSEGGGGGGLGGGGDGGGNGRLGLGNVGSIVGRTKKEAGQGGGHGKGKDLAFSLWKERHPQVG